MAGQQAQREAKDKMWEGELACLHFGSASEG